MNKVFFLTVVLLSFGVRPASSQVQTREVLAASPQQQEQTASHSSSSDSKISAAGTEAGLKSIRGVTVTALPVDVTSAKSLRSDGAVVTSPAPTSIYRVGVGDVLDIHLLNSPIRESTLYSVLAGGLLEYPLAGDAIRIQGLTTDEIGSILISKIKLYESPHVTVSVREYASHNVIITGLVRDPGTKALRREAVPLFVVLAEAQPRPDAARAIIMRSGSPPQIVDIVDTVATTLLIYPNDVIRLVAALPPTPQFFYIAGQIGMAGQRDFHPGMTLTQSIFASGGVTRYAGNKAKVMRQGIDGRLITSEYNLKRIGQGKDPDPQIEAGDRIEVSRSGW